MRIVLLGKPGSGKGTQAGILSRRLGLAHLASGSILRAEIRDGTPFGREIERYVLRGEIGPQELIASVVFNYIERSGCAGGFILDGFPRTLYQARELDLRYAPDTCILISVPDSVLLKRIAGRLTCGGCGAVYHETAHPPLEHGICDGCGAELSAREDDRSAAIKRRLEIYRTEVEPVVAFYCESRRLTEIDGTLPRDEVSSRIMRAVTGASET